MLLTAIGGLALFLLGIHKIAGALQEMLGPSARRLMSAATRSPFHALLTGTGVAAATQSGTATAMTALGLVGGGLIGVSAGIALLLGAKLGATLAIQLAAFSLGAYAWAMIGVGYFSSLWQRFKQPGTLLLGAGLLFLGLDVTVDSMTALAGGELFSMLIEAANNRPLAMLVIGAALGAILSSGNAVTALGLGLYLSDGVSLSTAIALVAGGNAGSSLMPLLVSRTFDASAQRAALMQMLVRAVGALAVGLFVEPITDLVAAIGGGAAREIANAHTFFNLAVALVGTVLASPLARLSGELVPKGEDDAAPKYLRKDAISNRKLAPALALRETI
ncbi:MAG: Na/Pi symporter, partial [Trueperaceae bacterium]